MSVVVAVSCVGLLAGVAGAADGDLQSESETHDPQVANVDDPQVANVDDVHIGSVDDDPHIDIRIRELSLPEYVDEDTSGMFELEVMNAGRDDARMEITHEVDGTVVTEEQVVADRGSSTETSYTVSYDAIEDAIGSVDGEQTLSQRVSIHAVGVEGGEEFEEEERGGLTVVGPEEESEEEEAEEAVESEHEGTVDDVSAELVDITDSVEVDGAVTVAVEITNPTANEVDGQIQYGAAGDLVHRHHVEMAGDEARVFRFRVPVERISRAADIQFPPGEVTIDQHVRMSLSSNGERAETLAAQEELDVLVDEERWRAGEYSDLEGIAVEPVDEDDDGQAAETPELEERQDIQEEEAVAEAQQREESAETQRGFLTNDGDGTGTPLDDPFVLTVVGFLLSVLSILYQMSRM